MTKKSHRKGVYHPKRGINHLLDSTREDFDKDESGRPRKGISGVRDIRRDPGYKRLLEELNWWIAHSEGGEPGLVSPMRREIDVRELFHLANLTIPQRRAMLLRVEGHSLERIAEILGPDPITGNLITPGAVQARLNWARIKLKVLVADVELLGANSTG